MAQRRACRRALQAALGSQHLGAVRFRNAVWGNGSFHSRVVAERSLMLNLHKNCGERPQSTPLKTVRA